MRNRVRVAVRRSAAQPPDGESFLAPTLRARLDELADAHGWEPIYEALRRRPRDYRVPRLVGWLVDELSAPDDLDLGELVGPSPWDDDEPAAGQGEGAPAAPGDQEEPEPDEPAVPIEVGLAWIETQRNMLRADPQTDTLGLRGEAIPVREVIADAAQTVLLTGQNGQQYPPDEGGTT